MQAVHEAGHVLGVWASGGRTVRVVWHPATISRTDFADCPHPAVAVWAGPIVGVLGPLAAWGTAVAAGLRQAYLLRLFAGFCLLANGAYLAGGSFAGIGDCGELLNLGVPHGALLAFGALTIPAGLFLWHGQGPHFGLGPPVDGLPPRVSSLDAALSAGLCLLLLAVGFLCGDAGLRRKGRDARDLRWIALRNQEVSRTGRSGLTAAEGEATLARIPPQQPAKFVPVREPVRRRCPFAVSDRILLGHASCVEPTDRVGRSPKAKQPLPEIRLSDRPRSSRAGA